MYLAGEPGMLVRFARCCNPVPGDEIVGYITRGRGVAVHKADCINAINFEPERIVEVSWANPESEFLAGLQIVAYDRDGLLADLAVLMSSMKAPIESVSAKIHSNGTATINLQLKTKSREQLDRMIKQLQKRTDIIEVFRIQQ